MALSDNLVAYFNLDEVVDHVDAVVDYHENENATPLRDINDTVDANPSGDPNSGGNRECPDDANNNAFDTVNDAGDYYQTSTGPISGAFWIAPTNFGAGYQIMTRWDNLNVAWQQWRFGINHTNRKPYFGCRNNAATVGYITASDSTLASGTLMFVAGGYDPASDVLWISADGCSKYTTAGPGDIRHLTQANFFTLGAIYASHDPGSSWRGLLARVGLWKRVLTDSDLAALYNAGAGRKYPFSGGANAAMCGECGDFGPGGRAKIYMPPFHPLP